MTAVAQMSHSLPADLDFDDEEWSRPVTALEAARYSAALKLQANERERQKAQAAESARRIFGDCLHQLTELGMKEAKARTMLGKWRGQAKDDALLVRIVAHAHHTSTPDPVSYVTKAIEKALTRANSTEDLMKGKWALVGWEAPRRTASGPKWRGEARGQVWRDPYGKLKVLPVEDGTAPPSLADEPGIEI